MFIEFDEELVNTDFIIRIYAKRNFSKNEPSEKLYMESISIFLILKGDINKDFLEECFDLNDQDEDTRKELFNEFQERWNELKNLLLNINS